MSYFRLDVGVGLVGAVLVLTALLFAWSRSPVASPAPRLASPSAEPTAPKDLETLGVEVYSAECASCHREGERRGRTIPALHGFAVELFVAENGREALIDFLFDGRVRRSGEAPSSRASHPEYDGLSNQEIAAVLNHMITSWGNAELLPGDAELYTPVDIASRR